MEKAIIDRFEGDWAVLEIRKGNFIRIERSQLPVQCREGDVLVRQNGHYIIDLQETEERRQRLQKKMENLFSE